MKTALLITTLYRLIIGTGIFLLLNVLGSCHHNANSEDDTFRQSIVDDPGRAKRKNEERHRADSIRLGDTAVTKEQKEY